MAERIVEQLKVEIEVLRLSALTALTVGAGTLGLLLGEYTSLRLVLVSGGIFITGGAIITAWRQYRALRADLATIGEQL